MQSPAQEQLQPPWPETLTQPMGLQPWAFSNFTNIYDS